MDSRKLLGSLEKLLPKIEEWDKDWIPNWEDDTQEKFYVAYLPCANKCFISADRRHQRTFAIYMSKDTAEKVKGILDKLFEKGKPYGV